MARRRTDLGHTGEATIRSCAHRGLSAEETAAELASAGVRVSARTASRRMQEARGAVNAVRAVRLRPVAAASVLAPAPTDWAKQLPDEAFDWIEETIMLAVDAERAAFAGHLEALEAESETWARCSACGSKLVPRTKP